MGIGKLSSVWKVNGTPIYEPSSDTTVMHTSIASADSGRAEDGYMVIEWVKRDIVKITMNWKVLTGHEVQNLISLMQGMQFTLTYSEFGTAHTASVYVSEVTYTKKYNAGFASEGGLCTDITAAAVQN